MPVGPQQLSSIPFQNFATRYDDSCEAQSPRRWRTEITASSVRVLA